MILRLNPIIRGWAAYYRGRGFQGGVLRGGSLPVGMPLPWALRAHPNKSRHWVVDRYFGLFNSSKNNRWVFGDRDSGTYPRRLVWTKIVRHKMVMGTASRDDPALDWYWASRRRKAHAQLGGRTTSLLLRQRDAAPSAGCCCFTPTTGHSPRVSGSSGPAP